MKDGTSNSFEHVYNVQAVGDSPDPVGMIVRPDQIGMTQQANDKPRPCRDAGEGSREHRADAGASFL